jgi:hypothetical protein
MPIRKIITRYSPRPNLQFNDFQKTDETILEGKRKVRHKRNCIKDGTISSFSESRSNDTRTARSIFTFSDSENYNKWMLVSDVKSKEFFEEMVKFYIKNKVIKTTELFFSEK